jgi:hypothetical protein
VIDLWQTRRPRVPTLLLQPQFHKSCASTCHTCTYEPGQLQTRILHMLAVFLPQPGEPIRMGGKPRKYRKPCCVLDLHVQPFRVARAHGLGTPHHHVPGALEAMFTLFDKKQWWSCLKRTMMSKRSWKRCSARLNSSGHNSNISLFGGEFWGLQQAMSSCGMSKISRRYNMHFLRSRLGQI